MIESPALGCGNCEYKEYDSFHDEVWCNHIPKPEGLCGRFLVNIYDKCEHFKNYSC